MGNRLHQKILPQLVHSVERPSVGGKSVSSRQTGTKPSYSLLLHLSAQNMVSLQELLSSFRISPNVKASSKRKMNSSRLPAMNYGLQLPLFRALRKFSRCISLVEIAWTPHAVSVPSQASLNIVN